MKGYKVVSIDRRPGSHPWKGLRSVFPFFSRSVIYEVGKPVSSHPGYGPLCVFRYKKDALRFIAEDVPPSGKLLIALRCTFKKSSSEGIWDICHYASIEHLPKGTVLADEVTLTQAPEVR